MINISEHYDESRTPGWIPQGVNNDGVINTLDMIIIGQYWTIHENKYKNNYILFERKTGSGGLDFVNLV